MSAPPISDKDALAAATAMAAALGLDLIQEHRAGVALNLARLMTQAHLVMSVPLAEDMEPASIFTP
ncbi:MAG: AtzG-like protein [Sphingomonadales bacterium]